MLDVFRAAEEIAGSQAFTRASEQLPKEARDELAGVTAVSWVTNSLVIQVWRTLLRFTSDEA